jgi:DNA-binding transcriptional LysR family regulator
MTLNQLRAFLAVARTGSFTAAAADLQLTQASVSELIRRLEEEYGLALFLRNGRRRLLTSAGDELVPFAEGSVTAADNGGHALRSLRSLAGGVATFGVMRNAGFYLLADLAQEFHERYPQVRVRLIGQNSAEVAAAVAGGELEAGLIILPVDDDGLEITPLLRDEVLYASRSLPQDAAPVTLRELAGSRLILYDAHYGWNDPTRRQLAERARREGLKLDPWIEVEHVESALNLVARGVGHTLIARAVANSAACPSVIRTVPFAEPIYDTIALIQRQSAILSPATRELARLARRTILGRYHAGEPSDDRLPCS